MTSFAILRGKKNIFSSVVMFQPGECHLAPKDINITEHLLILSRLIRSLALGPKSLLTAHGKMGNITGTNDTCSSFPFSNSTSDIFILISSSRRKRKKQRQRETQLSLSEIIIKKAVTAQFQMQISDNEKERQFTYMKGRNAVKFKEIFVIIFPFLSINSKCRSCVTHSEKLMFLYSKIFLSVEKKNNNKQHYC